MSHDDLACMSPQEQQLMARSLGTQRPVFISDIDYLANVQFDRPKTTELQDFTYRGEPAAQPEEKSDVTSPYRAFVGFISRLFGHKQPQPTETYAMDPEPVDHVLNHR